MCLPGCVFLSAHCIDHRQLTVEVATAHKVAGMFGRRDPMRRYMDKITAMADELGALVDNCKRL